MNELLLKLKNSLNPLEQGQAKFVEKLNSFEGWEDRFKFIIEIGKKLPAADLDLQVDENKIKGCQSQVWLKAEHSGGLVKFKGESDALIVKGLVAMLIEIYSGYTPEQILNSNLDFLKLIGLESQLTPSRSNGLNAMIKQIYYYAHAFRTLEELKGRNK